MCEATPGGARCAKVATKQKINEELKKKNFTQAGIRSDY